MKNDYLQTDIVIIGGGMSGLHTAYELEKQGVDFILIEARERLGGRVLSSNFDEDETYKPDKPAYDLGPSWFWPGQTRIESLIDELALGDSVFQQQGAGKAVYEDHQGNIQKDFFGISMEGAYRLRGGIRQIVSALGDTIKPEKCLTQTKVSHVEYREIKGESEVLTSVTDHAGNEYQIMSHKVIIALPPRLAMKTITFQPALPSTRTSELNSYATWMAGHAKFIAVYDSDFWVKYGLSGDAFSHVGPLREIHDASSDSSHKESALFGFVGISAVERKGNEEAIRQAAIEQLVRMFGKEAAKPKLVVLQDWAQETYTSTESDFVSGGHATSSIAIYTEAQFSHRLIWSGTETADFRAGHNGLLEGALEASVRTLGLL